MPLFAKNYKLRSSYHYDGSQAKTFCDPVGVVQTRRVEEVCGALEEVEELVEQQGLYAAGFLSFEAGAAFDRSFPVRGGIAPLVWFGLYESCFEGALPQPLEYTDDLAESVAEFKPQITPEQYAEGFAKIKQAICNGETYQVNYTMPLSGEVPADVYGWFYRRALASCAQYCMYLDTGKFAVASLSPELFFRIEGEQITTRPMKGTRRRGLWCEEDRLLREELVQSEKDRAENLMIVDLLRNDLGRICKTGSIDVTELCTLEQYPTVWQMVSQISGQTSATYLDIFRALFPCGSVTGAPKSATMKMIHQIEPHTRGVYCGAVGWMAPGRRAVFNVPIRTLQVETDRGRSVYGVGGGIVWDSELEEEYAECMAKSRVLQMPQSHDFALLETLLYKDGAYFLLERHLDRLQQSAAYFGFCCDEKKIRAELMRLAQDFSDAPYRVRLTLSAKAELQLSSVPLQPLGNDCAVLAAESIDSKKIFLYHKTTQRSVYELAARGKNGASHVILYNDKGEVTESDIANVVIEKDGRKITPPVRCGLLGGVMREELLAAGEIEEGVVRLEDLAQADAVWLINSVRGWMKIEGDFALIQTQP